VGVTQVRAGAAAQSPRGREHRATGIDAGHAAAGADELREVAQHDAGPTADLEHGGATPDRDRAEEALTQPALRRVAAARLERRDDRGGLGGALDLAK